MRSRKLKKSRKSNNWIQNVDKEIDKKNTKGAFTRQARNAGYENTLDYAKAVMKGWKKDKKVYNKKNKRMQRITEKTMRRANFALSVNKQYKFSFNDQEQVMTNLQNLLDKEIENFKKLPEKEQLQILALVYDIENSSNGQLLFDSIMQEIIDMSGSTEMLTLFVGKNMLEIESENFKETLTAIVETIEDQKSNIIVRKKYTGNVYHYYGIRNNKDIVQRNKRNLLYNVKKDLKFKDIIKKTKEECKERSNKLLVGNGYPSTGLIETDKKCSRGIGLAVQPESSHNLCAIYALIFMFYGLSGYKDFDRLLTRDDPATLSWKVAYNSYLGLLYYIQLLTKLGIDKEYVSEGIYKKIDKENAFTMWKNKKSCDWDNGDFKVLTETDKMYKTITLKTLIHVVLHHEVFSNFMEWSR